MKLFNEQDEPDFMHYLLHSLIGNEYLGENNWTCMEVLVCSGVDKSFTWFLETTEEEFKSILEIFPEKNHNEFLNAIDKLISCQWYTFFLMDICELELTTLTPEEWKSLATPASYQQFCKEELRYVKTCPRVLQFKHDYMNQDQASINNKIEFVENNVEIDHEELSDVLSINQFSSHLNEAEHGYLHSNHCNNIQIVDNGEESSFIHGLNSISNMDFASLDTCCYGEQQHAVDYEEQEMMEECYYGEQEHAVDHEEQKMMEESQKEINSLSLVRGQVDNEDMKRKD